jgi:hypothetical protein
VCGCYKCMKITWNGLEGILTLSIRYYWSSAVLCVSLSVQLIYNSKLLLLGGVNAYGINIVCVRYRCSRRDYKVDHSVCLGSEAVTTFTLVWGSNVESPLNKLWSWAKRRGWVPSIRTLCSEELWYKYLPAVIWLRFLMVYRSPSWFRFPAEQNCFLGHNVQNISGAHSLRFNRSHKATFGLRPFLIYCAPHLNI